MATRSLRHPARLAGASLLRLQSDERLAVLAVDGHEAAFATIVERYRPALLRYCAGIVGPARAEDAVQQALISAHAALPRTDVRHLRSWLYRIAHNTSLNVLRSVRDDVSLDAAATAPADGPDAAFERAERLRATLDAVRGLPERQRAALVLRELEGRSHEEIATALGVTAGSARQHLMRARAAVRSGVTAITPYPLVAKLAGAAAAGPAAATWGEAAAGAGLGATLTKVTASVMATGALVGGAVGTERIVAHHRSVPPAAARQPDAARVRHAPVAGLAVAPTAAVSGTVPAAAPSRGAATAQRRAGSGKHERRDRARRGHGGGSRHSRSNTSPVVSGGGDGSGTDDAKHGGRGEGSGRGNGRGAPRSGSGDGASGNDGGGGRDDGGPGTAARPVSPRPAQGDGSGGSHRSGASGRPDQTEASIVEVPAGGGTATTAAPAFEDGSSGRGDDG
jgi:RNA polymerase sigma factor (sigma-70 family)